MCVFKQIFKNDYSWTLGNGLTVTGSCAASCTAVTPTLTGTTATAGTTCSNTVYGNSVSASFCWNPTGGASYAGASAAEISPPATFCTVKGFFYILNII